MEQQLLSTPCLPSTSTHVLVLESTSISHGAVPHPPLKNMQLPASDDVVFHTLYASSAIPSTPGFA